LVNDVYRLHPEIVKVCFWRSAIADPSGRRSIETLAAVALFDIAPFELGTFLHRDVHLVECPLLALSGHLNRL
jgi:hypothetical protein